MKVWIDISNAPHVRFFKDVIKYLEAEGEDVIVTARQFGDIHKLLEMYDTVCALYRSLDTNPNYTLLSAVLCARL